MIRKLFGGIKMTWKTVIAFAVIAGIFTAFMAMWVPNGNSFHEIAVSVEAWILFAIVIITNCETPKDAACKTFVFFLISQPLVYLIQVPFSWMGWRLFMYYGYWFKLTLLTFPAAYIGWHIKKDNVLSALLLSVMLILLAFLGVGYAKDTLAHFPNHLISTLFCFGQIPLLIYGVFRDKKAILTASAISVAAIAVIAASVLRGPTLNVETYFQLDEETYPTDVSFTVRVEQEEVSTAEIKRAPDGPWVLHMSIREPGENAVILTDPDGNEHFIVVSCDADGRAELREL